VDAARLGKRLAEVPAAERATLLQKLKSGQGSAYTQALAAAIPKLDDAMQKQARQALADRLSDMKTSTLRQWLQYEDREIRRAAALACAMKDDKSAVPDLIALLDDREALVARAAHAALKSLTGQDLGPAATASPADRARAVAAWKEWWKRNGK
jgi:HEAT repeat protein